MKVFALGGAGLFGLPSSRLLTASDLVTKIVVAGRNIERAQQAATELGDKASAVQVDANDVERLASLLAGYDLLVDTAPDKVLLSAVRAAIGAKTHYCNLDAPLQVLRFDAEAKAAGIIVSVGNGALPGLTNLMAVHAASQLEKVEVIQVSWTRVGPRLDSVLAVLRDPQERLAALRELGYAERTLQRVQEWLRRWNVRETIPIYQDGQWMDVDPFERGVEVTLPQGGVVTAYPILSSMNFYGVSTLRRHLPGVRTVGLEFSRFPPPLDDLFREQVRRVAVGEIGPEEAASSFYKAIADDPDRWLVRPEVFASLLAIPAVWTTAVVTAFGGKRGRAARYACWATSWGLTHITAPGVVAALKILRSEIEERGVLPPEACFEPEPFFGEVARLLSEPPPDGKLVGESFAWLDSHRG